MHSSLLTVFGIFFAAVSATAADPFDMDFGYGDSDDYDYGYGLPYAPPRTVTAPGSTVTINPGTRTAYLPTTEIVPTIMPTTVTATANYTRTYTTTSLAYSACYTTAYDAICATGICHKTYTVTEHCATACPTIRPTSSIPKGFTTTVTVCKHCGPQPTTMTLTYCPTVSSTMPTILPTYTAITPTYSMSTSHTVLPTHVPCYNCTMPSMTISPTVRQPPMNSTMPMVPAFTGGAATIGANGVAVGLIAFAAFFL